MKTSEEFRASKSIRADFLRWKNGIELSSENLRKDIPALEKLVCDSIENRNSMDTQEFERRFADLNELVDSIKNELYSLDEVIAEITGCEIVREEAITKAAKAVSKEIKALREFEAVGESYAKAISRQIRFPNGPDMVPNDDFLSAVADLKKSDQESQVKIDQLLLSLESRYKHAEQLGEHRVA